jgi:hypothetical protein
MHVTLQKIVAHDFQYDPRINAERQQFPHPQLLTPDDDQLSRNML